MQEGEPLHIAITLLGFLLTGNNKIKAPQQKGDQDSQQENEPFGGLLIFHLGKTGHGSQNAFSQYNDGKKSEALNYRFGCSKYLAAFFQLSDDDMSRRKRSR